ncbi:MAG: deoxyribose-phosphate aldolase [Spirochaetaceae bacterium]|jgi:deoxyribose-phosphate aldolase|nr:deoxyribose-phosphate aldolase [Spirochaetaceae bacterium]
MTSEEIFSRVDHTLLKASSSWAEIDKLCYEAARYRTASVCVPPSYVKPIKEAFADVVICTVIGFPLGYNVLSVKAFEAREAIAQGASEVDMVINVGEVKNRNFDAVLAEIRALREAAGKHILKVIVETCYLDTDEKIKLCGLVSESGADYIKTSTGFGSAGAVLDDVLLFRKHLAPEVKIKAAGGIRTRDEMEAFINAGADRIGSSSAVAVLARE